jgi:hypothetical protein
MRRRDSVSSGSAADFRPHTVPVFGRHWLDDRANPAYRISMTTKRSKYDPLATSRLSRWLVLRDMFHNVLDATELVPGTDLRLAFADGLAALERDGWQSEGASGGMVFVRRGGERRLLSVHEHDPHEPLPPGHGVLAGRCATCE